MPGAPLRGLFNATHVAKKVVIGTANIRAVDPTRLFKISSIVDSLFNITHHGSFAGLSSKNIKTKRGNSTRNVLCIEGL